MAGEVTKADVMKARAAIAKASEVEQEIAKAKACGMECEELDERCQHAKNSLIKYNEIYGPSFPTRSQ